jgi:mannose-6-phosphate isomerase-like protein (cupin superfamily)
LTQLECISDEGVVLAYLARQSAPPAATRYLTPDDCNLQVGHVIYASGTEIPRHMHLPVERHLCSTAEVLLVQQGRCEVDIFGLDRQLVTTRELQVGDILIAVAGGHGFRVFEDTVLLEVKQGPYPGGAEKERF